MNITQTSSGPTLSSQTPVDYAGIFFGAAIPMIGVLKDKVTLGVDVYVPVRHVFRSHIIDEGTAYFLRYDNAPERFQLAMSLDVRPWQWLSIGAGAQVLSNYGGEADFQTVLGMQNPGGIVKRTLDSDVTAVFAPIVGVAVGPFKGFRIFAFWRGEMITTFSQPINVNLGTFGNLDVTVNGVTSYSPHTLGLGASLSLLDDRLLIGVDIGYEHWSDIPPLVPDIHIDLPQTLQDLGFNKQVLSRQITMEASPTSWCRESESSGCRCRGSSCARDTRCAQARCRPRPAARTFSIPRRTSSASAVGGASTTHCRCFPRQRAHHRDCSAADGAAVARRHEGRGK